MCYFCFLQALIVFLFLSFVSTLVFSRTGGALSHPNFLAHRSFGVHSKCVLPRHAGCVHSHLCNGYRFLLSFYLSRIGNTEYPSSSDCVLPTQDTSLLSLCTVQLRTQRRRLFGDSLSLYDLWSSSWGSFPTAGAPWSSAMPPSLGRDRIATTRFEATW